MQTQTSSSRGSVKAWKYVWAVTTIFTTVVVGLQDGWPWPAYLWLVEIVLVSQTLCWTLRFVSRLQLRELQAAVTVIFFIAAPLGVSAGVILPVFFGINVSAAASGRNGLAIGSGSVAVAVLLLEIFVHLPVGRRRKPCLRVEDVFEILTSRRSLGGPPFLHWLFIGCDELSNIPVPDVPGKPKKQTARLAGEDLEEYLKQLNPLHDHQGKQSDDAITCFTFVRVDDPSRRAEAVHERCALIADQEHTIHRLISALEDQQLTLARISHDGKTTVCHVQSPCAPVPYQPTEPPTLSALRELSDHDLIAPNKYFSLRSQHGHGGKHVLLVAGQQEGDVFWSCCREGGRITIEKATSVVF